MISVVTHCGECGATEIEINSVGVAGFEPSDFWLQCKICGAAAEARGSREDAIEAWNNRSFQAGDRR